MPRDHRGRRAARGLAPAVALLLTGCAGTGPGAAPVVADGGGGYTGTVVAPPVVLPDARLTGTDGKPFDLRGDTRAAVTLVVFAYTSCPDECPLTVSSITAALRGLTQEQRRDVELLVLAADPQRDTPDVLRRWLARFGDSLRGATGEPVELQRVARELYVPLAPPPTPSPDGSYDVSHGLQVWAFGADDRSLLLWSSYVTPGELRDDLVRLLARGGPAGPPG